MDDAALWLFPDTNSLLHYPPVGDVDWRAVCGCKFVHLMLCLPVIHELDEKKDDSRLGDRARRIIKELKGITAAGGVVRDGVVLEIFNYELRREEFPGTLSYDSSDDRIVHAVKGYGSLNPEAAVAVYSEDMGMSLRCQAHGVKVIEPDEASRWESPQTEFDKKYKTAITELNALKNAVPAVECVVSEENATAPRKQKLAFAIRPKVGGRDVDAEFEEYRKAGHVVLFEVTDFTSSGQTTSLPPQHDAVAGYNAAAERHLAEYHTWLTTRSLLETLHAHAVTVTVWLTNSGMTPADDIDLTIEVSDMVALVYEAGSETAKTYALPDPPSPPVRPKQLFSDIPRRGDRMGASTSGPMDLDLILQSRPHVEKLKDTSTYRITYSSKRVKHNEHERVGTFVFVLKPTEVRPFDLHVRITAANVPNVIQHRIPVVVRVATE